MRPLLYLLQALLAAGVLVDGRPLDSTKLPSPKRITAPLYGPIPHGNHRRGLHSAQETVARAKAEVSRVRAKYHIAHSPRATSAKRQKESLVDVGPDSFYYAPVAFGTPPQTMALILDTGSSDTWLVSDRCQATACADISRFATIQSTTFALSNLPWALQYGKGEANGTLVSDRVELGGAVVDSLTFGIASDIADGVVSPPASGLMGMGRQELSGFGVTPFWQVLAELHAIQPIFSFQLARDPTAQTLEIQAPGGIFTLGELDATQYTGPINWVNVTPGSIYWDIQLDAVTTLGHKTDYTLNNLTAVIDTGTCGPCSRCRAVRMFTDRSRLQELL